MGWGKLGEDGVGMAQRYWKAATGNATVQEYANLFRSSAKITTSDRFRDPGMFGALPKAGNLMKLGVGPKAAISQAFQDDNGSIGIMGKNYSAKKMLGAYGVGVVAPSAIYSTVANGAPWRDKNGDLDAPGIPFI